MIIDKNIKSGIYPISSQMFRHLQTGIVKVIYFKLMCSEKVFSPLELCAPCCQKFSVVKFSPCGPYLAASSTEGHLVIWNSASHQVLSSVQTEEKQHICSLDWSPQLPQIAFCDKNGNFGTIDLQLDSHKVAVC